MIKHDEPFIPLNGCFITDLEKKETWYSNKSCKLPLKYLK